MHQIKNLFIKYKEITWENKLKSIIKISKTNIEE